jgi:hypothetical protein
MGHKRKDFVVENDHQADWRLMVRAKRRAVDLHARPSR